MLSGNEWLIIIIGLLPIALIVALVVFLVSRSSRSTQTAPQATGSLTDSGATPAGWFPDPSGRHQRRYWDGISWTQHVNDNGQPGVDPP